MSNASILKIDKFHNDLRRFMPLLLIGDESEKMIERYIDRGTLYASFIDEEAVAVCLTTIEDNGMIEIKNLAVVPEHRKKGIGRTMLAHIENVNKGRTIILGTGETPSTLRFYEACGYRRSHIVHNFFKDNYDIPIIEEGVELCDMIYFTKDV